MNAGSPDSDPAVSGRQSISAHSADSGLENERTADIDALLGDAHLKRQLAQLDHLGFDHFEDHSQIPASLSTLESQSSAIKNPLAPDTGNGASLGSPGSASEIADRTAYASSEHPQVSGLSSRETASPIDAPRTATVSPAHSEHSAINPLSEHAVAEAATAQNSRQGSMALTDEETPHISDSGSYSAPPHAATTPSTAHHTGSEKSATEQGHALKEPEQETAGHHNSSENMPPTSAMDDDSSNRVSAYARLDFDSFTFYVQTLQVVLGRRSENGGQSADVDVHLGPAKAISRRHAKIFYNFATQRFELTVIGRNGAFVGDVFVETGSTVPLRDSTKVQIGQIAFNFVLPLHGKQDENDDNDAEERNDEELEIEEPGAVGPTKSGQPPTTTNSKSGKGAGLGSERGRGGKLKQRAQATKPQKDGSETAGDETTVATIASDGDSNMGSRKGSISALPKPSSSNVSTPTLDAPSSSSGGTTTTTTSTSPRQPPKPRQLSFNKRADENNLFAHVPPDQLAAVNAQVDAAIAGLPDIPGFDTPSNVGPSSAPNVSGGLQNSQMPQHRLGDVSLNQLLGLQTQLGNHRDDNLSNLNSLAASLGVMGNGDLTGFQGLQDNSLGLQSLQQLQALQNLQGFDGLNALQNLQGLQGLQGLQPAAGLGLLQQLQVLQRGKQAGIQNSQSTQTRQKRKPRREYRPEEIPEQYRTKPAHSYSHLITAALRDRLSSMPDGTQGGLSLGDIYEAIMDLFPYYRYCPPGWQNSVRHNLSSSKSFRKVSKEGKGWLWGLDEEYLAEKEKQRQRALQRQQQQALAQQQAMAEQHAREQAREQARQLQLQRDRERELEQRRFLAERAARAAQVGVPLHQLSATLGTTNFSGLASGDTLGLGRDGVTGASGANTGISGAGNSTDSQRESKPAVLPPETVKLLAGLQQHVQQELAKDGQPPLNPQLLSNALAVVIAQTAKQAGGLQSLGHVLQQPGAVQKLLNQAMQLLRSTQRVPPSVSTPQVAPPSPSVPDIKAPAALGATAVPTVSTEQAPTPVAKEATAGPASSAPPSTEATPSSAQIRAQPQVETSSTSASQSHLEVSAQKAQPHILQPSRPDEVKKPASPDGASTVPAGSPQKEDSSSTVSAQNKVASENGGANNETVKAATPSQGTATATPSPKPVKDQQPAKKSQPSLEKISEILAKAEAIPNPSAEVKGMIDKLKAHKRQLELKRSADSSGAESPAQPPTPKRQAVE